MLIPLSHLVTNRRLWLFGHIAHRSPREDHHRALAACIRHGQVPPDWKRPAGRPSHIWLRAIEADLGPLNSGLATAWRKATTRDEWRHIVDTATLPVRSERRKKKVPKLLDGAKCQPSGWVGCYNVTDDRRTVHAIRRT